MKRHDELKEMFEELGEWEEVKAGAQKELLAHDIREAMRARRITPSEMARRMKTSRESVYRLLDPSRPGVTLDSLQRAASALGMELNISIRPIEGKRRPPHRKAASRGHRRAA